MERVEVLPFHQMGRYKWERLGLDYTLRDVEPPTTEAAELASEMFRKAGLRASWRSWISPTGQMPERFPTAAR